MKLIARIFTSLGVLAAAPCLFADPPPTAPDTVPLANADNVVAPPEGTDVASMDADAQVAFFLQQRRAAASDPHRSLYHFSPPGFAMHDVAGICRWQGKYHLFYLFSPPDMRWGRGHAVIDDLVHWRDLPKLPKSVHGGTGQAWAEKDRQCLTLRAYPTRPDSTGVSLFARGSEAKLVSLTAYQMKSIWPELKGQEGRAK